MYCWYSVTCCMALSINTSCFDSHNYAVVSPLFTVFIKSWTTSKSMGIRIGQPPYDWLTCRSKRSNVTAWHKLRSRCNLPSYMLFIPFIYNSIMELFNPPPTLTREADAAALRKAMKGLGKACMHVNLSVIQNNVYGDSDISSKNRTLAFLIPLINVFYEKRTI